MRGLEVVTALSLVSVALGACFVDAFSPNPPGGVPCTSPEDCPDDENPCTRVAECVDRICEYPLVPDGFATLQSPGDCQSNLCVGGELESEIDDTDLDDGLPCTADLCQDGVATHTPIAEGGPCQIAGVFGTCVDDQCEITCVLDVDCPSVPCQVSECTSGLCTFTPSSGDPEPPLPDTMPGDCRRPTCVDGDVGTVAQDSDLPPDDNNVCTIEGCDAGVVTSEFVMAGTGCVLPMRDGVCNGGGLCVECVDAADCPAAPLCRLATCVASTCGESNRSSGTKCDAGFASDGQCLDGVCVECVIDTDCSGTDDVCCTNVCDPRPCP
jgi:hypothetical protein